MMPGGNVGVGTTSPSQKLHISGNMRLTGAFYDVNNDPGTSGQILSSTATGVDWIDPSSLSINPRWSSLTDPIANLTLNHSTYTTTFNSSATTGTFFTINANSLTSGKGLYLSSTSTGLTGNLAEFVLSGSNASNTGNVLRVAQTGTSSAAVPLMVTNLGTGLSFRVNDETGDNDSTPFVIDASGNVGIGNASPSYKLDVSGTIRGDYFIDSSNVNYGIDPAGTSNFGGYSLKITGGAVLAADSGNVGIGTNNPNVKLDVNGNVRVPNDTSVILGTTLPVYLHNYQYLSDLWVENGGTSSSQGIVLGTGFDGDKVIRIKYTPGTVGAGGGVLQIGQDLKNHANYTHGITTFLTNGAERLRIDSSGNIGIGTNSPGRKLDVTQSGSGSQYSYLRISANPTNGAYLGASRLEGVHNDSANGELAKLGWISFEPERPGVNNVGGHLRFYTKTLGGNINDDPTVKMSIDHSGNVGIGTTSPSQKLHISGNMRLTGAFYDVNNDPGTSGQILSSTATGVDWIDPSSLSINPRWSSLTDPIANLTLNHSTYTTTFNSSATTGTFFTINANSLTSGKGLYLSSTSTGLTGNLAEFVLSGSNASNTGNVLRVAQTGTSSAAVPLMVTNLGTGLSFRVNDETGDNDSTPFVIDASGNVGIGSLNPEAKLHVVGTGGRAIILKGGGATDQQIVYSFARQLEEGIYNSSGHFRLYDATGGTTVYQWDGSNLYLVPSSGNLGIGTTSPGARTQINAAGSGTKGLIVRGNTSNDGRIQEWQNSSGGVLSYINRYGNLVVGTTGGDTSQYKFYGLSNLSTNPTYSEGVANFIQQTATNTNITSATMVPAFWVSYDLINSSHNFNNNIARFYFMNGRHNVYGQLSNTSNLSLQGFSTETYLHSTGTGNIPNIIHFNTNGVAYKATGNSNTITNLYLYNASNYDSTPTNTFGFHVNTLYGGTTYGIYLANQNAGTTDSYAIYSVGGKSYFGGNIGLGVTNPSEKLEINGNIRLQNLVAYNTNGSIYFISGTNNRGRIDTTPNTETQGANYSEATETSTTINAAGYFVGESFKPTSSQNTISRFRFRLRKPSTNACTTGDKVHVRLYITNGSGTPTTFLGSTTDVDCGSITTTAAWFDFYFNPTINVSSANEYVGVLVCPACSASKQVEIMRRGLNNYTGGVLVYTSNFGATWNTNASDDVFFDTYYGHPQGYGTLYIGRVDTINADLAENYPSKQSLSPGDIVMIDHENPNHVKLADSSEKMIGVVSTAPGLLLGSNEISKEKNLYPIALAGRVPVKVTDENGPIVVGDPITLSTLSGYGTKTTKETKIIGYALEPFNPAVNKNNIEKCYENNQKIICGKILIIINFSHYLPHNIYLTNSGDAEIIQSNSNYVYDGIDNFEYQKSKIKMQNNIVKIKNEIIERISAFAEIVVGKIQAGLIEVENTIVNNTLLAKNIVAESINLTTENLTIAGKKLSQYIDVRINKILNDRLLSFNAEKITSPVVETEEIQFQNQNAKIKMQNDNAKLKIIDRENQPIAEFNPGEKETSFTGSLEVKSDENKGKLAQLILKSMEGKQTVSIDASGNASFSGTLASSSIISNQGNLRNLSVSENATISGSLAAAEASLSGKLVAKEIEAENINQLTSQLANQQTDINEIQKLLADLKNQPLSDPTNQTNLSNSTNLNQLEPILTNSDQLLTNLTVSGQTNLYNASISNSLVIGNLLLENDRILSLSWELKLSALSKINFFDGAVVIAKDGTITAKGELIAQGGVKTNKISPISSNDNLLVQLPSNETRNSKLEIRNSQNNEIASIDASGSAYFKQLALEKFTPATPEATIIAASENFKKNGVFAPAIETNTSSAGVGILPENQLEIIIYNNNVKENSLIYLTPQGTFPAKLTVAEKKNGYFKVIGESTIHPEIKFDWLIIN
ncbi:MAG: hypothetical protein QW308_03835 [Candidatus Woesearchaeota archaeon]